MSTHHFIAPERAWSERGNDNMSADITDLSIVAPPVILDMYGEASVTGNIAACIAKHFQADVSTAE